MNSNEGYTIVRAGNGDYKFTVGDARSLAIKLQTQVYLSEDFPRVLVIRGMFHDMDVVLISDLTAVKTKRVMEASDRRIPFPVFLWISAQGGPSEEDPDP